MSENVNSDEGSVNQVYADLTAFQRDTLWVLYGEDDYPHPEGYIGLQIREKLEDYYENQQVNHGRLYPNLNKLTGMGLVQKQEIDGRTNGYSITSRGREVIESRREWESN